MALTFGAAATDRVDTGNFTSTDAGTIVMWLFCTDGASFGMGFQQAGGPDMGLYFAFNAGGTQIQFSRSRATSYLAIDADRGNFSAWGLNKWLFIGYSFDPAAGGSSQKVIMGSLTALATEPSSYVTQTAGSGTPDNTAGVFRIANKASLDSSFKGRIAFLGRWNTALTVSQMQSLQFRRRPTPNCVMFYELGLNGTGTQYSSAVGGGNGTVTGATVGAHVPLPWRRSWIGQVSVIDYFARPVSDKSTGSWSTAPLFSKVDEAVTDDGDFIQSSSGAASDASELGFDALTLKGSVSMVVRHKVP